MPQGNMKNTLTGINNNSDFCSYKERDKQQFVNTFKIIFDKAKIDKPGLFYNFYAFLLFEVFDHVQHKGMLSFTCIN